MPTIKLCWWLTIATLSSLIFIMPAAQAASCKLPKSYYKNVSCTAKQGYFLAIKDFGEPVALIDSKGKVVVDLLRYQRVDAHKIAGDLMPVQRNSRVGYINMQGREVIPALYDILREAGGWARPLSEGRIVVKKDGKYGVISSSNQTIVPFSAAFSVIDNYGGGRARAVKNNSNSWLDQNGRTVDKLKADERIQAFADKAAKTTLTASQSAASFTTLQPQQQDGRWGFVDEHNTIMITYSFDEVRPFSEGLAGVRIDDKWGFLNLGGELIIPFNFAADMDNSRANNVNSNVDSNLMNNSASSASTVSEIGSNESAITPTTFVFNAGKAWVGHLQNGAKICIDKQGATVSCD